MRGLQALAVHGAVHLGTGVALQLVRAILAITLAGLAYLGTRNLKFDARS
jgi:hypothetical protein